MTDSVATVQPQRDESRFADTRRTQAAAVAITGGLAILTAFGIESVPLIVLLAAVLGLVSAFGGPALQAVAPQIVPDF